MLYVPAPHFFFFAFSEKLIHGLLGTEYQGSKTYANSIWATLGIPIDLEAAFGCDPLVDILGGESW